MSDIKIQFNAHINNLMDLVTSLDAVGFDDFTFEQAELPIGTELPIDKTAYVGNTVLVSGVLKDVDLRTSTTVTLTKKLDEVGATVLDKEPAFRTTLSSTLANTSLASQGSVIPKEVSARLQKRYNELFVPIPVGSSLLINRTTEIELGEHDQVEIKLRPTLGVFGLGGHPSTVLALRYLEKTVNRDSKVVDIGVGSGILSIASAKLGSDTVYGVDLDDFAIETARQNAKLNDCAVTFEHTDFVSGVSRQTTAYNLIVANLIASIHIQLAPDLANYLSMGDTLIASGIENKYVDDVVKEFKKHSLEVADISEENGWTAILCTKN